MRTVSFLRSSTGFYGAESVIVGLARQLPRHGWQARFLVLQAADGSHNALVERARENGIDTREIPCRGKLDLRSIRSIGRHVREHAEVLHCHDFKSNLFGWLAARGLPVPVVSTVHGWTSDTASVRAYERLDRVVLRRFDAVIGVSRQITDRIAASVRRYEFITNGVDTRLFSPGVDGFGKRHWGIPPERFVFGIFARFTAEKAHAALLDAFRDVARRRDDVHLMMTGSGPEEASIRQRVAEHGLVDRVTFVAAHGDVHRALHDIDCYVSPSLTEGMPMILLEAMASGVPIVATRVGFVPSMLEECGFLVDVGDVAALSAAMLECAGDASTRREFSRRAVERAVERYSAAEQARRHALLYADLSAGAPE